MGFYIKLQLFIRCTDAQTHKLKCSEVLRSIGVMRACLYIGPSIRGLNGYIETRIIRAEPTNDWSRASHFAGSCYEQGQKFKVYC